MQPAKRVNIVSLKLVREGSVLYKERQAKLSADVDKLLISECALYLRNLSKDIFEYMEGFSRFLSNRLFGARLGEEGDDWKWLKIQEKTTESAL